MCESSGSQFFRTTTRIQSGPDAFDESRFIMTLLTILGYRFWLVLEGRTGKKISESSRLKFLGRFLANIFALSDAGDNNNKKGFMAPFYGWGSTVSRLKSHYEDAVYF